MLFSFRKGVGGYCKKNRGPIVNREDREDLKVRRGRGVSLLHTLKMAREEIGEKHASFCYFFFQRKSRGDEGQMR